MRVRQKLRQAIDSLYIGGQASAEAYTRLVLGCVRANDVDQAKRLQSHMDLHYFTPSDTFLHNRLLHLYAKSGKILDARNLFDKMPQRDVISWNAMLSAYAKSGSIENLIAVFDEMPFRLRDSVSYNTVIAGLAGSGFSNRALEVFARMNKEEFEPTEYTHVSVLNACSRLLDLRKGNQIHGRIVVGSLGKNVFVWNALTDMYGKCGEIDRARWLFDRIRDKSIVSWNSMISGYLKNGQPEKCIDLFRKMQLGGLKPDEVTVSNVLGAYFQRGLIDEASKIFGMIKNKDKVCWTTMIVGYAQNGKEEDALNLFGKMLLEGVNPDNFTISSVVSSCARLASLCHGQVVHGKAILLGVDDDLLVSSALVDMYCKCGVTRDAWVVFDMIPSRNVISWNAMITGYAQNGQDLYALALYEKLLQENLKPDSITFVAVLSACNHAGLIEEGRRYFDSISKQHSLIPTLDHYACMINLLGRSGCMREALDLIKNMPHEPNSLIWSTLLSVCAIKGDIKHGEMAAKCLFGLEPHNAGPYIMLSNMYATCGRWEDVASVRSLMKIKNVKKFAAYSWIEIDNEVHKFVSEDRSHPETEIIYEELSRLIKKLKEAGFVPDTKLVLHNVVEEEKFASICYHSEKLALAFGLIKKPQATTPIRIMKNIRVCGDCHLFMKFVSKIIGRPIILRDSNRFHHFVGGSCSCKDYW
ncbi:pentatricopeptide repeat-containing protein At2g22070-like [Herrania umbratica]|uniref:Pentatricopeptide repeat-containing protein At2g22070-like n=1 Tax=Herrania umbratica TaxID=108875 RepID=A0A6J0ZQD2_9ROSI|nr:pentatricopeptide repeat-containing protein At2g22070-like [Herrania umbratica]